MKKTTRKNVDNEKKLRDIFDDIQYAIFGLDDINKQPNTTDMPDLEPEESAALRKNQEGQGLKILTPEQMLSRLPISLAQLKAGNNSQTIVFFVQIKKN